MKYKNTVGVFLMLALSTYCIVTPSIGYFPTIISGFTLGLFIKSAIKEFKSE